MDNGGREHRDEIARLRLVNKTLAQNNKSLRQELNGSHHTNVGLLATIANLEQELRQLRHSAGLS